MDKKEEGLIKYLAQMEDEQTRIFMNDWIEENRGNETPAIFYQNGEQYIKSRWWILSRGN